ncbi:MAG: hypothetical protein P8M78_10530 [Myxococcota bacterium]|nr:hypothetical protein [Myxococcota bacterium]
MPIRMPQIFRGSLVAILMLCFAVLPAMASDLGGETPEEASTPVVFDTFVMKPLGVVTFVGGVCAFVASLPIVAVTRPQDIGVPFQALVGRPARFVWGEKIGGE